MNISTPKICSMLVLMLTLPGCNFVRSGGSGASLNRATDAEAIVDFISDEGHLTSYGFAPSSDIVIPGFTRVVHYRLYFHLNRVGHSAEIYRIEQNGSIKKPSLPAPTFVLPAARDRVLLTSFATDAVSLLGPTSPTFFTSYALDAQKTGSTWEVLKDNDPDVDVFSLFRNDKRVAMVDGSGFGLDRVYPRSDISMAYFTWDQVGGYVIFYRHIPRYTSFDVPEVDVWYYNCPTLNLQRYTMDLDRYFVWQGKQFDVRDQYKSLLR